MTKLLFALFLVLFFTFSWTFFGTLFLALFWALFLVTFSAFLYWSFLETFSGTPLGTFLWEWTFIVTILSTLKCYRTLLCTFYWASFQFLLFFFTLLEFFWSFFLSNYYNFLINQMCSMCSSVSIYITLWLIDFYHGENIEHVEKKSSKYRLCLRPRSWWNWTSKIANIFLQISVHKFIASKISFI